MRLRLRDATAVTELRVQSHLRQCQKRRSPFPAVKRRPSKEWPISQREDQCTIPRVLSIVAVAPMWSCRMCTFVLRFHAEDLMASPVYRRRLDDAEKSLPVPTKVKRETFRTIRTSRDGGSRCNGPQTPARP